MADQIFKNWNLVEPFKGYIFPRVQRTWNSVLGDFWGRWLWIWAQNAEIQNSGSNMANKNGKGYLMQIIVSNRWFSRSLIMNPSSKIRNWKRRIRYGWLKYKKQKLMPQRFPCGIHFVDDWSFVQMCIWGFYGSLICLGPLENLELIPDLQHFTTRREFLRKILYKNIAILAIQHSKMYFVNTFGDFSHTVERNSLKSVWEIPLYILV